MSNVGGAILMLCIICGFVGWGVIEFILWLTSFVHITLG